MPRMKAFPHSYSWFRVGLFHAFRCIALLVLLCVGMSAGAQTQSPVHIIDVMVLYTAQAKVAAGKGSTIVKEVEQAAREANHVFESSRVNARIRLVRILPVAYTESGSVATDINRLQNPADGFLDQVHALRDRHAADLVCLITETGDDWFFYGLQGPAATNGFSVVRRPYLASDFSSFAVALSFNFGCQVERAFADSEAAFPYAYGYTFETTNGLFSTVEAFTAPRLLFFSNPEIFIDGVPAGNVEEANNALALNQTAPTVSMHRGSTNQTLPPTVRITAPADGASLRHGTAIKLTAAASDPDGKIKRVDFFDGGRWIGSSGGSVAVAPWRNATLGYHSLTAMATDVKGGTSFSESINVEVRYQNDSFSNPNRISGTKATVRADNTLATAEPGEPAHAGVAANHSLWWTWTAPKDAVMAVNTRGSAINTTLAVYQGEERSDRVDGKFVLLLPVGGPVSRPGGLHLSHCGG
jgi:hypothetical protein